MTQLVKKIYSLIRSVVSLVLGIPYFIFLRKTPPFAYQGLINLFCLTGGKSNDFLSRTIQKIHPPLNLFNQEVQGIFGTMDDEEVKRVSERIREEGYYVFEKKLSSDLCDKLLEFSLTEPCHIRPMVPFNGDVDNFKLTRYDRLKPEAVRYDFNEGVLINHPVVQELFADLTLLSVAQNYLECQPVLDVTSMWWHTAFLKEPSKEAAQYYHFDMDRIKWLKFFFYLTNVSSKNGPHCFIARSHKTKGIPKDLLRQGYARLTDEEVSKYYKKEDFVEFTAPSGTIIAEDTRGLHKGKMVENGDRLVFQIQISNSLFG
jgi:hypothetical protein